MFFPFVCGLLFFPALIANAKKNYDGYHLLRMHPTSQDHLQFVQKVEENPDVNVWKRSKNANQSWDVVVPPGLVLPLRQQMTQLKLSFDILSTDMQTLINDENKPSAGGSYRSTADGNYDLSQYHTYAEMLGFIDTLVAKHPNLVEKVEIGKSTERRPLVVLKISSGSNPNKKTIWMDFGIHAREWISSATGQFFLNELITGTSPQAEQMREKFDFFVMPMVNPDGYEFTRVGDRFWRKNRRPGYRYGCEGVDLNRNFGSNFGGAGTSTNTCSEIYRGPNAFSEPESKAVSDFVMANKEKIIAFFTFHSYSQVWGYAWGHTKGVCPPDVADIAEVAETGVNAIRAVEGTRYSVGSPADLMYEVGGASDDWAKSAAGVKYTYVVELRPCDECREGFVLPAAQILPTARETWAGVVAAANKIDEHLKTGGNGLLRNGARFRTGCYVSDIGFKYPADYQVATNGGNKPENQQKPVAQPCEDNEQYNWYCNYYKRYNACNQYAAWTRVNCRRSCGYC